jgi:hypothetical protein
MASISTMLVGKYIYSQLQGIGQSNFFLEATLNRMKSVPIIPGTKMQNECNKKVNNHRSRKLPQIIYTVYLSACL